MSMTGLYYGSASPDEGGFIVSDGGSRLVLPLEGKRSGETKKLSEKEGKAEKETAKTLDILMADALCALFGVECKGRLSVDERRNLASLAASAGYLIVPDITREPIDDSEVQATLVPILPDDSLSQIYRIAHLVIELGIAIAMSDGKVGTREIVQLSYVMERHFKFTGLEIRALRALKDFCLIFPPGIVQTARRLVSILSPDERVEIAGMMTTVAASARNGQIGPGEIEGLLALFRTFEIDESELDRIIRELHIKRVWVLLKN
ncbi:MAG: hypothetical protein LBT31_08300 [Synergistaceae bacterium]|jgi:uncharacterized tellurite resistance protein B-like protein|nr:hypothetical protein [Synergistaceae bacterium]